MDLDELEYKKLLARLQAEDQPLETPMLDPIDFIPVPGGLVAKGMGKAGGMLKNAGKAITENEHAAMLSALEKLNPSVALAKKGIITPEYKAMHEGLQGQINDLGARVESEAKNKLFEMNKRRSLQAGVDPEAPTMDIDALKKLRK